MLSILEAKHVMWALDTKPVKSSQESKRLGRRSASRYRSQAEKMLPNASYEPLQEMQQDGTVLKYAVLGVR